jgi:hypothetical protein
MDPVEGVQQGKQIILRVAERHLATVAFKQSATRSKNADAANRGASLGAWTARQVKSDFVNAIRERRANRDYAPLTRHCVSPSQSRRQ